MILFSSEIFVVLLLWLRHLLVTLLTAIVFKGEEKLSWRKKLKMHKKRAKMCNFYAENICNYFGGKLGIHKII